MKEEVEQAIQSEQECRLCSFKTSKRRIRTHIRQHMCMHYCYCGYQHISRDQVAEHMRLTRHARSKCKIYMVSSDQYPEFREKMGWPNSATFGPLLPITRRVSRVKVELQPNPPPPPAPPREQQQLTLSVHSLWSQNTRSRGYAQTTRLWMLPALRHRLEHQRFFCRSVRALGGGGGRHRQRLT